MSVQKTFAVVSVSVACCFHCAAGVIVHDVVLPMEAGKDFIFCGKETVTNYGHSVEVFCRPGLSNACLKYNEDMPGVRPFRGGSVVLESSGELSGTVTLVLKPLTGGGEMSFTEPWTPHVRFETGLTAERKYVFLRLKFVPTPRCSRAWTAHVKRLYAEVSLTVAESCGLNVDTGNPLHICRYPKNSGPVERPSVILSNEAFSPQDFSGRLALADLCGHRLEIPFRTGVLASGESASVPLPWPMPGKGLWIVGAEILGDDGTKSVKETRFAVLDPHDVTPKMPDGKFRLGINYHMQSYYGWHRQMTLDAVVASGAKLVRSGVCMTWNNVQHDGPDSWDWTRADEMMGKLEERGLALDTIIAGNPPWAVNPDVKKRAKRWIDWYHGLPKDLGALERFCERLAQRYGTRVSYYEMGNEWDCNWTMSRADAAAIFTACANGLHRGNPAARMIPCGWAAWDPEIEVSYEENMPEGSMVDCKGLYVAHPVHNHGEFRRFRERTLDFFKRRKRRGLDDVPWYANETALSTVNGNEIPAAENVWKKILFAWGYGSCDYIWYNLRATGWNPKDPEQGFGMITADYYPRATYAAFSALATVLTGFDFDSILKSDGIREVFRFKGARKGKSEIVIAGWDANDLTGSVIRVTSDARKATVVDFMGNVEPLEIRDGELSWVLRKRPTALVLHDATKADPEAEALSRSCERRIPEVHVGNRAAEVRPPDLVVDSVGYVCGFYEANPWTVDRVWSGPSDCSFKAWFTRKDSDQLCLRVDVTDDVHSQKAPKTKLMSEGDCLRVTVSVPGQSKTWEFGFRRTDAGVAESCLWQSPTSDGRDEVRRLLTHRVSRIGNLTRYEADLPIGAITNGKTSEFMMSLKVDDSDGQGRDLWIGFRDLFKVKMPK